MRIDVGGLSGNVLVLPIILADKVPLIVFASGTRYPVDPRSLRELTEAVSNAYQRLIAELKSRRSDPPLGGQLRGAQRRAWRRSLDWLRGA